MVRSPVSRARFRRSRITPIVLTLSCWSVRIVADRQLPSAVEQQRDGNTGTASHRHTTWVDFIPNPYLLFGGRRSRGDPRSPCTSRRRSPASACRAGDEPYTAHAKASRRAMARDEQGMAGLRPMSTTSSPFATSTWAHGEQELNIFNPKLVLDPETATDGEFERIESVIA